MSSILPRKPYSQKELQELYPSHLQLHQVQIFLRHGERVPTSSRFEHAGLAGFWPYCSATKHLVSATLNPSSSEWSTLHWRRHLETFDPSDNPVIVSDPQGEMGMMCSVGELTDQGRKSSRALGTRLRHLYVDQLQFLPATIENQKAIYLRATRIPRALESLQEAFVGLYPPQQRSESFLPPAIILRAPADETLNPSHGYCQRFADLAKAFGQRSAHKWNHSPDMDYVNHLIGKWMPDKGRRVAIDSHPRLSGILDTVNSTLAHGPATRLPKPFYDEKVLAIMNRLVLEEWFSGYSESREYRTLGIGSLMGDIVFRMLTSIGHHGQGRLTSGESEQSTPDQKTAVRLSLNGCHDTTIAAMLTSLGAFTMGSWPQYTSHVAVELFRRVNTTDAQVSDVEEAARPSSTTRNPSSIKASNSFRRMFGLDSSTPSDDDRAVGVPFIVARTPFDEMPQLEQSKLDGYFVRIRYNDEPVTVPGCREPGKHLAGDESFCTLAAFKLIVDKFTPLNWRQECRSNSEAKPFPAQPQPAGY